MATIKEREEFKIEPQEVTGTVTLPSGPVQIGSEKAVPVSGGESKTEELVEQLREAAKDRIIPEPIKNE